MQGHWVNAQSYYRCRYPAEYAIANKIDHPRNVYLRVCHECEREVEYR
jgi:hypothetical protein